MLIIPHCRYPLLLALKTKHWKVKQNSLGPSKFWLPEQTSSFEFTDRPAMCGRLD